MSLKSWLLHKMNGIATRPDLPRSPVLRTRVDGPAVVRRDARRSANHQAPASPPPAVPHLGPYAPLVNAIREELETFVVSHLRLHLAIAERDRYVLTSIDVRATAPGEGDELLSRFMREFKPEQIKHYLEKEVIGALPNASAIDLTQFAGLNAGRGDEDAEDDNYSELLAELKSAKPAPGLRPFEVSLIGRWSEHEPREPSRGTPHTPLAGRDAAIAIEDADGSRRLVVRAVVPGRRYAIGKGEGCDIVVNGTYASRRHCEIWLDRGTWWVTDAGSTNGVRVERGTSVLGRSAANAGTGGAAVEVSAGARIVLSAHAEGPPADYPAIVLDVGREASLAATPIAPAMRASVTPSTPVLKTRTRENGFVIAARTASGVHTVEVSDVDLPFSVGRSRSQALVIDWAHEGVSGHHADITEIDGEGVTVVVHGDNGVTFNGKSYPPGARLRWQPGDSIVLGRTIGSEPQCHLTLSRHA
jgi:pSer/pThr/pTyr-binding forkhead associated (FHA) protein